MKITTMILTKTWHSRWGTCLLSIISYTHAKTNPYQMKLLWKRHQHIASLSLPFLCWWGAARNHEGDNRKIELFNDLDENLDFAAEGRYCLEVLCNALWYITNDHQMIANRCKHVSGLSPVPKCYEKYVAYKVKVNPLKHESLIAYSEA